MRSVAALSIAGSDSGGGAGIQADLAAFAYFDVTGTTAITAVTAQNPLEVTAVAPVPPSCVAAQIRAVLDCFDVRAAKTGMLFNTEIIVTVAEILREYSPFPLVVDPVMVATSGARLLETDAVKALQNVIFPLSALITPNMAEACLLAGRKDIRGLEEACEVCRELAERYGVPVLLKGGHDEGQTSSDVLWHAACATIFEAPRVHTATSHGTGCSLSSALAACLARGYDLCEAVAQAKAYVLGRLRSIRQAGEGIWVLAPPDELPLQEIVTRHG